MNDFVEHIKCGEILKLTPLDYKDQYILKCIQCEEYYCLLESFIFHCTSHSTTDENNENSTGEMNDMYNEAIESLRNDVAEIENLTKQYEEEMEELLQQTQDDLEPLTFLKYEPVYESDKINVKAESTFPESVEYQDQTDGVSDELLEEEQLSVHSEGQNAENIESGNEDMDYCSYPIFVKSFMNSKTSVQTLIDAYKNQPTLWNSNLPEYTKKESRQKSLKIIKRELNNQLNLEISCNHVAAVLTHLCREYLRDLKCLKSDLNAQKEPKWFFKSLDFLKPFAENDSFTIFECQPILKPQQIMQILAIYERFPHLWNTDLIENYCRNKHQESLEQMQCVIESEMGLKLSESVLKKNIKFIHDHFAKIKRRKPSNSNTVSIYYKHMTFLYDHVGPFKCSDCDQEFKSVLTFKVHRSQHDGVTALRCSLCNKEYYKTGTYIAHARRHMNDLNEVCKECGKKFLVACDLRIHMRSHTGAKPYCCEICGISFRHINALTGHRRRHQKQYLHICPICSKGYYTKDRMDDHMRSHNNIRDFACKTCGKAFITKKTLKQHEVTHGDLRKHVCTLCGKDFKLKVGLNQHMRTHGAPISART